MDDEKDDVFLSSSSSFSAGAPLLPPILPSTAATTTRATQAGVPFEDDAAGGRCRRARPAAGSRPGVRELSHKTTPCCLLFPGRSPLPLVCIPSFATYPDFFFPPDHGIISLKAHGGEGTTKEERLPYEATVYVPPRARVLTPYTPRPFSRTILFSFSRTPVILGVSLSPST